MNILCRFYFEEFLEGDFRRFFIESPSGTKIEIVGNCSAFFSPDLKKHYDNASRFCKHDPSDRRSVQIHLSRAAMQEAFNLAGAQDAALNWQQEQ